MSQVIRFKDLVQKLGAIDWIQIGDKSISFEELLQLEEANPLVHLEQVEFGDSYGEDYPYGIFATTYYITIL